MNPWTVAAAIGELTVIVVLFCAFERKGYKKGEASGYQRGFQEGHTAADNWWLNWEHEVTRTQKSIQNEERWP